MYASPLGGQASAPNLDSFVHFQMFYGFHSSEHDYLTFTIKLVMGIKSDGRHVQYSVNKIELI